MEPTIIRKFITCRFEFPVNVSTVIAAFQEEINRLMVDDTSKSELVFLRTQIVRFTSDKLIRVYL